MSKSTSETIQALSAIFLILTISLTMISTQTVEPQKSTTELQDIGYWEIFSPDQDQLIFNIDNDQEKFVREYNMKINCEMDIISQFIKKNNNRVPQMVADRIAHAIVRMCKEHNVPNELMIGIVEVESFYDPYAIGPPVGGNKRRRARGLGQILDSKCGEDRIDKDKLHNIDYNILYSIKIIKSKLESTGGDLEKSLYYYVGKDEEYASKVFKVMGEYRYFRSQKL